MFSARNLKPVVTFIHSEWPLGSDLGLGLVLNGHFMYFRPKS